MNHVFKFALVTWTSLIVVACATLPSPEQAKETSPPSNAVMPEDEKKSPLPVESTSLVVPIESAPPETTLSEKNLAIAVATFERGEYTKAMRLLSPLATDTNLALAGRLKAMKTLAFSQCLTGAVVACRITFERAFKLDTKFDLARAEQGHPVWGPQFERARKNLKIN